MKKVIFFLILLVSMAFFVCPGFAIEQAERISDREIIERLTKVETKLEENQKAVLQRIEDLEKRFEQRFAEIDKRFEEINRRFEDLNRQLDRLTAVFTAIVVTVIGFAYWDRRTIIKKAKEEALAELRKEDKSKDLINVLLELAKTDDRLAKVLRQFNIL
ncbi:MAG: hypothetical protein WHS38_04100 [Thermodesulforhabdaceae bacterium]|jgi:predicted PurR-regulated permease PerM